MSASDAGPAPALRIDAMLGWQSATTETDAATAERGGYDALWWGEAGHNPLLRGMRVAAATTTIELGTSIAVAFARSPMTMASAAYDLQQAAAGRFVLGLGSQTRPHIERRFSMPWSRPAARMREYVAALRAIWACWQDGEPLDFRGDFYTHTLMTDFFTPARHDWGPPPVYVAAVGERMTEVAGEVADGFFFHPFTTERYLREVTRPALARGRARAGDTLDDLCVGGPAFVVVGRDEPEMAVATADARKQLAFYASTPAYRPLLEFLGMAEMHDALLVLSKQSRWDEMGALVDDELLHAVAVVGEPEVVGRELHRRYAGLVDRISFYVTTDADPAVWPIVLDAVRRAGA